MCHRTLHLLCVQYYGMTTSSTFGVDDTMRPTYTLVDPISLITTRLSFFVFNPAIGSVERPPSECTAYTRNRAFVASVRTDLEIDRFHFFFFLIRDRGVMSFTSLRARTHAVTLKQLALVANPSYRKLGRPYARRYVQYVMINACV